MTEMARLGQRAGGGICMQRRQSGTRQVGLSPYQAAVRQAAESPGEVTVAWSKRWAPTLHSLEHLRPLVPEALHGAYFSRSTGRTDWELHAHGHHVLGVDGGMPSVDDLAAYFNGQILPSTIALTTREEYDGVWRAWVTFCHCQECLHKAFPTDNHTLRAFLVHLLLCGYAPPSVAKHLAAILHRQRQFGGPPPLAFRELATWMKPLRKALTTPKPVFTRLTAVHVRQMLELQDTDLILARDILMIAVGTVGAMRPSELLDLDVCDWLPDHDVDCDGRPLGDAVYVKRQKNDQARQGMVKRFAFGSAANTCLPQRMRAFLARCGLKRHDHCQKWAGRLENQAMSCVWCGRIFRKMRRHKDGSVEAVGSLPHALNADSVRKALTNLLQRIGVAPGGFTAKSMRRGGLSTAKRAGIPAALRREQSGHKSSSNEVYESPTDSDEDEIEGVSDLPVARPAGGWRPEHLYCFARAFAL